MRFHSSSLLLLSGLFLTACSGGGGSGGQTPVAPAATGLTGEFAMFVGVPALGGKQGLYGTLLDGTDIQQFSLPLSSTEIIDSFAISPDRKHVCYVVGPDGAGGFDIILASIEDGSVIRLPVHTDQVNSTWPCWAPDSSRVAFKTLDLPENTSHLYTVQPDGVGLVEVSISLFDMNETRWTATSLDVCMVGIDSITEPEKVYVGDANGTFFFDLTGVTQPLAEVLLMVPSPDGSRVAFASDMLVEDELRVLTARTDGTGGPIFVSPAPTGLNRLDVKQLAWSPDGSQLAYVADYDGFVEYELYVTSPISAGPNLRVSQNLQGGDRVNSFEWSPDGSLLAYSVARLPSADSDLFVTDTVGNWSQVNLSIPGRSVTEFTWSPDSRWVSYLHDVDLDNQLTLMLWDAQAQGLPIELTDAQTDGGMQLNQMLWSPDASRLAYSVALSSGQELRVVDPLDPLVPLNLASQIGTSAGSQVCRLMRTVEWSADSQTLVWKGAFGPGGHAGGTGLFTGPTDGSVPPLLISGTYQVLEWEYARVPRPPLEG